jgi:peptide/nickel transport system substrate-binding protein
LARKIRFSAHAIAVAAALGATLLGCTGTQRAPDTLVVAVEAMPTNLDPRFATDATSSRIDDLVFRSLTRVDDRLRHVPDLAVDWKSDSPLVVRFLLRPDATFSDGSRLTASDVRATYESVLDRSTGSPKREDLAFLDAIEAPDDTTVVFRLRKPFAAYLQATTLGIVPRATLGAGGRVLVGAGPYRIERVVPGQEVTLRSRADHGGIREIRFRSIPDDTVRTLETDQGNVDLSENAIEPDNLRWLEARERICVKRIPGTTFQYLGLNFDDPRLRDARVRRAIAAAIDRGAVVEHLLAGAARPATGLLPPEHWAYEAAVETHPYDPAAAKRLLDEAGYPDPDGDGPKTRFRIGYKTTTLDSHRRLGEALQAMLADVGIGLEVRSFEWATFYEDIRHRRFELYSLAWVGIADPDFFFTLLQSTMTPPRGQNRGGYADPTIDRLVDAGRETMDPVQRQRIYGEVQKRVAAELPFIPLWWTDNVVVHSKRLCGFAPRPDGSLDSLATAWLDEPGTVARTAASPCGCPARG